MKREKVNIKKIIKAKMDIHQKNTKSTPLLNRKEPPKPKNSVKEIKSPDGTDLSKLSKRDRTFAVNNPNHVHFTDRREGLMAAYRQKYESIKVGGYERNMNVDYEVIVCISSFNRFEKIEKLLSGFYSQPTKYTFKVILLDDKSSDDRYLNLEKKYPELQYRKNKTNNGRKLYWYTVTQLWQYAKEYTSNMILMIDDDFVLCDNFLNTICDFYYYIKNDNNNVVGIAPHLHSYAQNVIQMDWWYNTHSVDGACLFDRNFIASFDYRLEVVTDEQLNAAAHAHGWSQIQNKVLGENKMVYKTRHSLVYHDGNDESRLGSENKKKSKAYTYYFNEKGVNFMDLIV